MAAREKVTRNSYWNNGLLHAMSDHHLFIYSDDRVIVIKDKYPKAKYHFLVLPKQRILGLQCVDISHLELLQHMQHVGENIVNMANKELKFRLGFHTVASMNQLHLHVISEDFNSPCVKTKKHWNSFTTPFFLHSSRVIYMLKEIGHVKIDEQAAAKYLIQQLKCHICDKVFQTVPSLRSHIVLHDVTKKDIVQQTSHPLKSV